jgi:hypothetical protein
LIVKVTVGSSVISLRPFTVGMAYSEAVLLSSIVYDTQPPFEFMGLS